jgi:PAS domain S-box-containing protein
LSIGRTVGLMGGAGSLDTLFPGPSTMAALMRSRDWSSSPLGPPAGWPPSLRTACRICLTSRFPMIVWWGPELRFIYNDAYLPLLGTKHPALDLAGADVWPEIWHIIGPMLTGVLDTRQATWSEDLLLPLNRHGYREETYWTYSYSPLHDDEGSVRGVFTAVTDTTGRVIGQRRLAVLQDLGAQAGTAHTVAEACDLVSQSLSQAQADIPYFAVYLRRDDSAGLTLSCLTKDDGEVPARAAGLSAASAPGRWPLADVLAQRREVQVTDLAGRFGPLPSGSWPDPPAEAMVLPLQGEAGTQPIGVLVLAASAGRRLDEEYRTFMELLARQTAALINGAMAYQVQQRRAEELAELDRAKTAFFANISHEFRTPLTLIMGPVQDLRERLADQDEQVRDDLEIVHRNGLRLGKLVNALLDFSQIEAGRMQAHYEPTELGAFTADLASVFRAAFQRAGLGYEVDCPPLAEPVYVDREMWEKVVLNLLSNALKYTFAGSVLVRVSAAAGQAVLQVTDTGIGVAADEMPRLFERFHRSTGGRARSNEGSGIGLALVKELVALHGGTIAADSRLGDGSTFTVRIPLGRDHLPAGSIIAAATENTAPATAEPFIEEAMRWLPDRGGPLTIQDRPGADERPHAPLPSVLIADDNADMREYLQRLLQSRYRVTAVADGQSALAAARASPPDLIVSDVMMPGIDGLALVEEIRADHRTAAVPVLLLSARAGQEAAIEGLDAGADDYLIKPFAAQELLARVRANVELTKLRNQHAQWRAALTDSLQEGFFVAAADGSVLEVNAAFTAILGYGAESMPCPPPHPWWPDETADPDGYRRALATFCDAGGQPKEDVVLPLRHRDGHVIWAATTRNVIDDPVGHGRALVGTIRDVTAERLAAQREAAVAAMTVRLSQAATLEDVLDTGLAELRGQWSALRVLAASWEQNRPVMLTTTSATTLTWEDLQPRLRQTIETLRGQPSLRISTAADPHSGRLSGVGTTVEYAGGLAAIWMDLDGDHPFGLEDRTLLALLCGSLGQALNRARLLDQQREVALALQHAILGPGRMPAGFAVRYEPATPPLEVGGDWYDIAELPGERIGIIVGDCVGRGLAAASVMGQLRSACRALLLESEGPAQALAALDRFAAFIPDALCSTVFCGILDTATGLLCYASAGHPPGILAHPDGTVELLEQGRSLPLALSPEQPRSEATAQVPYGATLLLYTDGLVERRGQSIDVGTARAGALLSAGRDLPVDDLAQQIMTDFTPGQGYEDDVAILLYTRPAPLELAFRADPHELAPVRRQLRGWLRRLSLDAILAQDVLIAACEACANAIEHGCRDSREGTVRLRVEVSGADLRITVTDDGTWRPPRQVPYRGNGLNLIRATMHDVTITAGDGGTAIEMRARTP